MTTPNNKQLYVVKVTYEAYVWAEDLEAAEDFADEIVRTEDYTGVIANPAHKNVLGWNSEALVYHDGEGDLLLKDVLPQPAP